MQRAVTHIKHKETRDTFANLMNEFCHDIDIEPKLQPLQTESFVNISTTTEDKARLDLQTDSGVHSLAALSLMFKPNAKTA